MVFLDCRVVRLQWCNVKQDDGPLESASIGRKELWS